MQVPHNSVVVVADGKKMLFFRNEGDTNQIDLRTEAHEERDDAHHDRDLKTDGPGTAAAGSWSSSMATPCPSRATSPPSRRPFASIPTPSSWGPGSMWTTPHSRRVIWASRSGWPGRGRRPIICAAMTTPTSAT